MRSPLILVRALPAPIMWLAFAALVAAGYGLGYLAGVGVAP